MALLLFFLRCILRWVQEILVDSKSREAEVAKGKHADTILFKEHMLFLESAAAVEIMSEWFGGRLLEPAESIDERHLFINYN